MTTVVASPPIQSGQRLKRPSLQRDSNQLFGAITYPESDGKPMADNTKQFRQVVSIQGGISAMYYNDPNVFVAGDLLWYPVEGDNRISTTPDVMVVFGRPKGDRGAYLQWLEDDIAP